MLPIRNYCSVLLLFVLASLGCGDSGLKTSFVEGIVRHDGSPLEKAFVTFSPSELGGPEMMASGVTDSNGQYRLTVSQGGKVNGGTTPGKYRVSILKKTEYPIRLDPPPPGYPDATKIPIYGLVIPKHYTNPATSELTAEIKSGSNRGLNFDLTGSGDKKPANLK
ncbi:MAG: Ig-like domain-containing protein [Thermoguttaceae bacterium]